MIPLLLAATFTTTTGLTILILSRSLGGRSIIERRLQAILAAPQKEVAQEEKKRRPVQGTSAVRRLLQPLVSYFEKKKDQPSQKRLTLMLARAGSSLKPAEFLAANAAAALVPAFLALLIAGPLAALVGAAIGGVLPRLILAQKFKKRQQAFILALPAVLTMMANSLRSGFSFLQAMEVIAHEMKPPVSVEFERVLKEMQFGTDLQDALEGLGERIQSNDLDLIITAMLINRQVGGNLSEILETTATTLRERLAMRGQVKTLTAQGRMSGMVISMLPFGIFGFLWLTNRDYIGLLFSEPLGNVFIGIWLTGQTIGMLVIRKLTQIKY